MPTVNQSGQVTTYVEHDDEKGFAERLFGADRASAAMGMRMLQGSDGHARVAMTITDQMTNGHSITHGGYVFAMADTAFALACNASGRRTVSSGASIIFLAPTSSGDELVAEAVERARHGRTGVYDVTVKRGDHIVAEFRGNSREVSDRYAAESTGDSPAP
jgi:acyl-CoA thioesterase